MSQTRAPIDWQAVRRQLAESESALRSAGEPEPERLQAVLRERAARLAAPPPSAAASAGLTPVLAFWLGDERYGLALGELRRVMPLTGCTPVPGGPPVLVGLMDVQGEIRSVVDLAGLLGLSAEPAEDRSAGFVLLLRRQPVDAALRVDRLDRIHHVRPADAAAPPRTGGSGCVLGTADGVVLLDAAALRAHPLFSTGGSEA